jgi:thiamine-monophosphate kinase
VRAESLCAGEFELIARYFAPLAKGFPGTYGLLDDVALLIPSADTELVVKTDAIVGGIHFLLVDPANLVARKAPRVNLSGLAAKGATPRAYLLDLILPFDVREAWIADLARGLAEDQSEYGIHLIGGDTDRTPGPTTIAITALGEVATGRVIRRGGARAGDTIYRTGSIDDAALGLQALRGDLPKLDPRSASFLADRYRLPSPRATVGPDLIGIAA